MQHAAGFSIILCVLVESEPALQTYNCEEGHLLIRIVFSHTSRSLFNAFSANLVRDVSSEARKAAVGPATPAIEAQLEIKRLSKEGRQLDSTSLRTKSAIVT